VSKDYGGLVNPYRAPRPGGWRRILLGGPRVRRAGLVMLSLLVVIAMAGGAVGSILR
jgi:hypothetical protein